MSLSPCPLPRKSALAPSPEGASRADRLDRFGELHFAIERLKPEYASLKAEILSWHEDTPANRAVLECGKRFDVTVSARTFRRKIFDKVKAFGLLRRKLGQAATIDLISIPLEAAVDKHIASDKHVLFLSKDQTGPRDLVPLPKTPAA